jgi:DNA-binding CsgD family transcriptional regulator
MRPAETDLDDAEQPLPSAVPPLVGRQDCLDTLDKALNEVINGRFAVVEVSGEAGVGKTRLLSEARRLVDESGLRVYSGKASQFEHEIPLTLFAEVLQAAGTGGSSPVDLLLSESTHGQPVDRVRGYAAVRRYLTRSAGRGAALILDDLHWADETSLELTEYLIRNPPSAPILMVVAFRNARSPIRIVDAVARAGSEAARIRLGPLAETDLRVLLPDASPSRRNLLMRASRGNPLYLNTLARLTDTALDELVREHDLRGSGRVDESTRQVLRAVGVDLAAMDDVAQRVAHAIAVIGDHAATDLVEHVVELPVPTVVAALDQLCAAGLGDMDGAWFRFRHPLMRAATHDMAGPAWRMQAHARAAAYLRAHDGPLPLLAHHLERSAQYGDEEAAGTLLDAGESIVYRAPGTAARWLGTALRILSPASPLLDRRPRIVLLYARALGLSGELDLSWEVLQELLRDGHPLRTEAAAFGIVIARLRGDLDTAAALLDGELRRTRGQPVAEGKFQVQLAALASLREQPTATVDHAQRALHALGSTRPALAAAAETLWAWGSLCAGEPATARIRTLAAARLLNTVSDVTLSPHVELCGPLAWVEMRLGDLAAATHHLARAHRIVEHAGLSSALPYLLLVDAALKSRLGRLGTALHLSEQAALSADHMGSLEIRAMAGAVRLQPLLWTAGPDAVIAAARQLTTLGRPRSRTWWRVTQLNLAMAYAVGQQLQPCLDLLTEPAADWPADPPATVLRQAVLAQVLASTNRVDAARQAAEHAENTALAANLDYELGWARYAQACVATRANELDRASALADESSAKFAVATAPLEEARAHHLAGTIHALAGRRELGHEEWDRARTGYADCEAQWLLTTLTQEQRRRAQRSPRNDGNPTTTSLDTLTPRERQIADLAATGLTNQEIATRLFLSPRTVESHLARIFPKLNIRTRSALAHRLRE